MSERKGRKKIQRIVCRCDDCGEGFFRTPKRCKCGCALFKRQELKKET